MDVAQHARSDEAAEAEIERFISRRASEDNGTSRDDRDALWRKSLERYNQRRRREATAQWFTYFCRQAEAHRRLSEDYQRRAEELCEEEPG